MPESNNLGLPFLEAGQAQKHVTLNEALRILDAAIHLSVLAITSVTPATPAEGERHIVGTGASGTFAGHGNDIATFEDGAWRFLAPRTGWRTWVAGEDILYVFDGEQWRDLRDLAVSLDDVTRLGINTSSAGENLLAVRSNAAVLHAIETDDGGSGDVRLQLSKQAEANTASVFFSRDFEGRAEFGLAGGDEFKLKVSADGDDWVESLLVDPASGTVALPLAADLGGRVSLSGDITPAELTSSTNDYDPSGLAGAGVLRLSTDATRELTGLADGTGGRVLVLHNVGAHNLVLKNGSSLSSEANRFDFGADLTLAAKQGTILQYDGTASRWRTLSAPGGGGTADLAPVYLGIAKIAMKQADINNNVIDYIGIVSDSFDTTSGLNLGGSTNLNTSVAGEIKPTASGTTQTIGTNSTTVNNSGGYTQVDRTTALTAGDVIAKVGVYQVAADSSLIVKIVKRNSASNYDVVVSQAASHAGGGWIDFDLASSFTVPSDGFSYYAASYSSSPSTNVTGSISRAIQSGNITGNSQTITESSGATCVTRVVKNVALDNMTAVSAVFTLPVEPNSADLIGIINKSGSATVNTDYKGYVSIDGGTNYDQATLEEVETVGSNTVFRAVGLDVSTRTGTSLRWKLTTHNSKNVKFTDLFVRTY